jgi:hypothetical protein
MMSALYQINTISRIYIVLVHWNNSLWVDMPLHSDTLSWFRANQFLLFLHNAECLVKKQQIKFYQQLTSEERRVPFIFGRNNR